MPAFTAREVLGVLPQDSVHLVEAVLAGARESDMTIYLVGGPVRDLLLARPIRDVDLMVERSGGAPAAPDVGEFAKRAAPPGAKVQVHDRFGTASVTHEGGGVDLAGLRSESYAQPGALPQVAAGTLEDDLARRDFSVNALALRLSASRPSERCEVIDYADGLGDLAEGRLRVLHDRSFHDDPTRALRAARLAPRLGFTLTRGTRSALRDALRDGAFGRVSGDRLRREIERCFEDAIQGGQPAVALRRLADWHVLTALEPGLDLPQSVVSDIRRLGRWVAEPAWSGPKMRVGIAGMAVWFAGLSPAMRRRAVSRLALRGDAASRVTAFPKDRRGWIRQIEKSRGRGAVDAALAEIDEERLLALYASSPTPLRRRIARWALEDRNRRVPVAGNDLVALGLGGEDVGRALMRIRAGVLDGEIGNREEALALAAEVARRRARSTATRRSRGAKR